MATRSAPAGCIAPSDAMQSQVFEVIDPAMNPTVNPASSMPNVTDAASFADRYLLRLENGADTFVSAARHLAHSVDEGVIFHCSAGKDRTGLLAAFVLSALDVDRQTIVDDYAASDEPMQRKFAHHMAQDDHEVKELREKLLSASPVLLRAPAGAMSGLLDLVDEHHDGIVNFFTTNGFTETDMATLRTKLLV